MTLAPLFVQDIETVKARLRMSGAIHADVLIEEAMRAVRVGFYRRISFERIAEIAAFVSTENPSSEEQVLRQLAEVLEVKWIRMELMRTIPSMFLDSTPSINQVWNEEGMLRGMGASEQEKEIQRLKTEIDQGIILLEGDEVLPDQPAFNIEVYIPVIPPSGLGSSLGLLW